MNAPDTPYGKRILHICQEWQKTRPVDNKDLKYLAAELGLHVNSIYKAIKGKVGMVSLDAFEAMGYSRDWILNGRGPKKAVVDKKQGYIDVTGLKAETIKLRQEIFFKITRISRLEKQVEWLTQLEQRVNELEKTVADLQEKLNTKAF